MEEPALESEGFAYYLDELRRGSADPYVAYRVYDASWRVPQQERALLRAATIRLLEADPWFLATATPHFLHALRTEDLERLTPLVGAGPARKAAPLLRAMLWYHAREGAHARDRAGRVQLRRALAFLQDVPRKQRDRAWHAMLVGCYRVLDYDRYKRAFATLLEVTAPDWRALELHWFLDIVAAKKDWRVYDRYRRAWDQLPRGHHACECYVNSVYTNDGLRAAAAGTWDAIPEALTRAVAVRGCPHLNTGGLRLDLVRLLVSKKKQLDAARGYLDHAAGFDTGDGQVSALREKLETAARRARGSASAVGKR
jgi:hypothetical protein